MRKALEPGTVLQGRYRILSLAGMGGIGFVYRIHGLILNKELALKEIHFDTSSAEEKEKVIGRFRHEAETLARLSHPGIPRIFDAFLDGEKFYLVMEFIEGSTLEYIMSRDPDYLSEKQVLEWTAQVLDILQYLHSLPTPLNVRDIKPSNIMLSPGGAIRLIDFGIARIFGAHEDVSDGGTERFAPPEQYGSGETDARSDIYSLGVSIYFLLTKVLIPDAVERSRCGVAISPPSFLNPGVTPRIDSMVLKMIALKPEDRFQSIQDVRAYLGLRNTGHQTGSASHVKAQAGVKSEPAPLRIEGKKTESDDDISRETMIIPASVFREKEVTAQFCKKCGSGLEPGSVFCPGCGRKLQEKPGRNSDGKKAGKSDGKPGEKAKGIPGNKGSDKSRKSCAAVIIITLALIVLTTVAASILFTRNATPKKSLSYSGRLYELCGARAGLESSLCSEGKEPDNDHPHKA